MKGQHPTGLTEVRAVWIQLKLFSHPNLQLLPGLRFPCETWMWWFISLINDLKFSFTRAVSVHKSASLEILKALERKILTITCCLIAGVLEWREEPEAAVVWKRISGKSESCEPSSVLHKWMLIFAGLLPSGCVDRDRAGRRISAVSEEKAVPHTWATWSIGGRVIHNIESLDFEKVLDKHWPG